MREHVLGAGGRVITLLRTRPLGSRFFDHPMISESPRLWFIPLGHLSLVGPAPVPPEWANQVESRYLERLRVRPGLVNTHFVRSRVNIAFADEAELALEDANSLGFKKKVALLLRSIPALVLGSKENALATEGTVTLFGLSMANRSRDEAVAEVLELARDPKPTRIAFVNPACINIAMKDSAYSNILLNSDLVYPDGIGIQLACKLTGKNLRDNLNGTDLYPALADKMAETGQGFFLFGGRPGVCEAMIQKTLERLPQLRFCGHQHGYYKPEEEEKIVAQINNSGADVLLVAMGVPQQEKLIDRLLPQLNVGMVMGVGGLFDFYSGRMPRAPLWMREIGMEWSYRLIMEPRRMWRRYLIGNLVFLWHLFRKHHLKGDQK